MTIDGEDEHREPWDADAAFWRGTSDCQQAIETLYHYLDGELTDDRRKVIQRHLEECSPCLEAFDFEAELKIVIARKCRDQVPDHLRERVQRALTEAEHHRYGMPFA